MEMEESTRAAGASSPAVGHRVFLAASLAAINNLAFGYDVGVISGSLADMASTLDLSTLGALLTSTDALVDAFTSDPVRAIIDDSATIEPAF